jgi:4-hydroxy-tetrahydrodipicolinate synthase
MTINLNNTQSWHGLWTALITPFNLDNSLDEKSLKNLIIDQIHSGVRGLVIAGSTGEGSLLSEKIYFQLLSKAKEFSENKIPLVAGLGIGGTETALHNLKIAKQLGYSGALASPPAYIKAPQRALANHFLRLAEENLPICLYEIQGRSASSIEFQTLIDICQSQSPSAKNIVALKDASANMTRAMEEVKFLSNRLALLSGDDESFFTFLALGGHGVISVASHLLAKEFVEIFQKMQKNQFDEARQIQNQWNPFIRGLFWESNPIPVKSIMYQLKRIASLSFQSPLCSMNEELLKQLVKTYEEARSYGL